MNGTHLVWGLFIIGVCCAAAVLLIHWATWPAPLRGVTPPPPDRRGYLYTCHCSAYDGPVRIFIDVDDEPRRGRDRPPTRHRVRSSHAFPTRRRVDSGGEGSECAPSPVAEQAYPRGDETPSDGPAGHKSAGPPHVWERKERPRSGAWPERGREVDQKFRNIPPKLS